MRNVYSVVMGSFYAKHFTTLKDALKNYYSLVESGNYGVKMLCRECVIVSKGSDKAPMVEDLEEALHCFRCLYQATVQVDLVPTERGYFLVPHDKEEATTKGVAGADAFEVVLDSTESDD